MNGGYRHRVLNSGWLKQWLRAAQLHAERITQVRDTPGDAQVDGWLFAAAIANVERAAIAIVGKSHPAVLAYQAAVPDAKDVRDMVTHFDHYIRGKGWLQRLDAARPVQGFNVFVQYDGDSLTLHVGDRSVRVAEAYRAAAELVDAVFEVLDAEAAEARAELPDDFADDEVSRWYQSDQNV